MNILLDVSQQSECNDAAAVIAAVDRVAASLNILWRAARMLGHDIAMLLHSDADKRRVIDILKEQTSEENPGLLAGEMDFYDSDIARSMLTSVLRGLQASNG